MSLLGKTCGVRIYEAQNFKGCGCDHGCEDCRIGCFNPAAYRNPFFGLDFHSDQDCWWRGGYNYSEYLCAKCYDSIVYHAKSWEEIHSGNKGYVEDPEYTKLLESL